MRGFFPLVHFAFLDFGVAAMSGFVTVGFVTVSGSVMLLMKLLGAIRPFEFMALAGNGKQGNGH
jgi:hypothetical protein